MMVHALIHAHSVTSIQNINVPNCCCNILLLSKILLRSTADITIDKSKKRYWICWSLLLSVVGLEQQGSHASHFALFFDKDLKVLIDDCHGQKNSSSAANGTYNTKGYNN